MRAIIDGLLHTADPDIQEVHQGSAVDIQPKFPFIVHKMAGTLPSVSRTGSPSLEVWVYDEPGSYLRIDRILARVRLLFEGTPYGTPSGDYIAVMDYQSTSPDLPAEEFHGIARMSTYKIVGRSA